MRSCLKVISTFQVNLCYGGYVKVQSRAISRKSCHNIENYYTNVTKKSWDSRRLSKSTSHPYQIKFKEIMIMNAISYPFQDIRSHFWPDSLWTTSATDYFKCKDPKAIHISLLCQLTMHCIFRCQITTACSNTILSTSKES